MVTWVGGLAPSSSSTKINGIVPHNLIALGQPGDKVQYRVFCLGEPENALGCLIRLRWNLRIRESGVPYHHLSSLLCGICSLPRQGYACKVNVVALYGSPDCMWESETHRGLAGSNAVRHSDSRVKVWQCESSSPLTAGWRGNPVPGGFSQ